MKKINCQLIFAIKMNTSNQQNTGIVLCGGKSSRFGKDKGLALYNDKVLVSHAIEMLKPHCDEIILSTNNEAYHQFGFQCVRDEIIGKGPLAGIVSSLRHASHQNCIVVAGDMPNVVFELFDVLLKHINENQAVVPVHNGLIEPLAAVYRKSLFPLFEELLLKGIHKMTDALKHSKTLYFDVINESFFTESMFLNINFLDDIV